MCPTAYCGAHLLQIPLNSDLNAFLIIKRVFSHLLNDIPTEKNI